ncbi:hypothetical protein [Phormidium sp. FACHB-1136]|uniref:hypothetical protein n=1 Tax=Phormidium sp. FACHB-1136 TaxID=2692848 RepID=UPI001682D799|nr:hypothetical protein [Phormidium sp. FACHB-1136]MBD2427404.1 hypothetical protein [Phormidium sp. FACHB-1136]
MTLPTRLSQTLITLLALGTLSTSALACAPPPDSVTSSDGVTASPPGDPIAAPIFDEFPEDWYGADVDEVLTPAVRDRILQNVAADLDRPVADLRLAAAETAIWNGCIGIYVPDMACTEIAILGLRVVVTDGNQSWVYHTHYDNEGHGVVQNPTASGSRNGLILDFIPKSTASVASTKMSSRLRPAPSLLRVRPSE